MKKSLFGFLVLLLIYTGSITSALGQVADYNTMIGITGGTNLGGTVKQFFTPQGAADLLVYRRWDGWVGALLYEHHFDIREVRGLEWYVGGGGHYGYWSAERGNPPWVAKSTQDYRVVGLDAIIGLEHNINQSNFYFGIYWKPAINFQDFSRFWGDEAAFTLRYSL